MRLNMSLSMTMLTGRQNSKAQSCRCHTAYHRLLVVAYAIVSCACHGNACAGGETSDKAGTPADSSNIKDVLALLYSRQILHRAMQMPCPICRKRWKNSQRHHRYSAKVTYPAAASTSMHHTLTLVITLWEVGYAPYHIAHTATAGTGGRLLG